MSAISRIGRYLPALLAFACVLGGSLVLLSRTDDSALASARVQVVVLRTALPAGASASEVRNVAELRELPTDAVVRGALTSLDSIGSGVLATAHAESQQLTTLSMAQSRAAAIGANFVVTSVRLSSQNWTGAVRIAGNTVDVYALTDTGVQLVSQRAVVLDAPSVDDVQAGADSVVTIAVRLDTLGAVLLAAQDERLWLVGR